MAWIPGSGFDHLNHDNHYHSILGATPNVTASKMLRPNQYATIKDKRKKEAAFSILVHRSLQVIVRNFAYLFVSFIIILRKRKLTP